MAQKTFFGSLALTCIMLSTLHADCPSDGQGCGNSPRPMRVTARHIESKGIGYNQGYTTLEGFFSPIRPYRDAWIPFLDLRGHAFNNGKMAANAGLGLRYLTDTRIWGANAYYDYRNTTRFHYNQFALGFESLGKVWDFRINGYLPLKETASPAYGSPKFVKFQEHNLIISRKRQFALKGANAEVGAHVDTFKDAPMYFAAGPYYLQGRGEATWGGQLRAVVDLYEYLRLEANTSYDHTFKWIGQGQVSVNFSFGARRKVKRGQSNTCSTAMALSHRAVQRVDRFEIIPVDKKRTQSKAINPETGEPYVFWFVENTSSSFGTIKSPFPTLAQAQSAASRNDVIYVFAGDGTSKGMDAGIVLKDGQKLFGAGTYQTLSTTVGRVAIPAQEVGMPTITGPSGFLVLMNDNEVSGIHAVVNEGSTLGIVLENITNAYIHDNFIDGSNIATGTDSSATASLLALISSGGKIQIENNIFQIGNAALTGTLAGATFYSTVPGATYLFNQNEFISPVGNGAGGITLGAGDPGIPLGDFNLINISNNHFFGVGFDGVSSNDSGWAIDGFPAFSGTGTLVINENIFTQTGGIFGEIVGVGANAGANLTAIVTNNVWQNSSNLSIPAVYNYNTDPTATLLLNLINNSSDSTGFAYYEDNGVGGSFTANTYCNIGFLQQLGTITPGTLPPPSDCLTD